MKRIILDTSVYGKFVEEPEIAAIVLQKVPKEFVIYGTDIIKKELRETPRSYLHKGKKLRVLLLSFYNAFVRKDHHNLQYNKLVDTLVKDYLLGYRKRGGNIADRKIRNDMIIIATATIYKLDIVISDDGNTMMSPLAIATYHAVNKVYGIQDPAFKTYRVFKAELLRSKDQEGRPV